MPTPPSYQDWMQSFYKYLPNDQTIKQQGSGNVDPSYWQGRLDPRLTTELYAKTGGMDPSQIFQKGYDTYDQNDHVGNIPLSPLNFMTDLQGKRGMPTNPTAFNYNQNSGVTTNPMNIAPRHDMWGTMGNVMGMAPAIGMGMMMGGPVASGLGQALGIGSNFAGAGLNAMTSMAQGNRFNPLSMLGALGGTIPGIGSMMSGMGAASRMAPQLLWSLMSRGRRGG